MQTPPMGLGLPHGRRREGREEEESEARYFLPLPLLLWVGSETLH